MAMTWCFCDSCCIICPTLDAVSPEMPVSISSKIIVGRYMESVMMDLRQSMMRDISPPDAILDMSAGAMPALAEKRKVTKSEPVSRSSSVSCSSTRNLLSDMPSFRSRSSIAFTKAGIAFLREAVTFLASSQTFFSNRTVSCSISESCPRSSE